MNGIMNVSMTITNEERKVIKEERIKKHGK